VKRIRIGLGINRHGLDPELAAGLDDPNGDLASIGDQNFLKHVILNFPQTRRGQI
jgi:hypothetical protein